MFPDALTHIALKRGDNIDSPETWNMSSLRQQLHDNVKRKEL